MCWTTCGYVTEYLGDQAAVLVVDETGDVKQGTHTMALQRQYTGTAGKRPRRSERESRVPVEQV